jgi:cell division protein FtsL
MLVLILLIIILVFIIYLATKKNTNKQKIHDCTHEINESTFNQLYKISRDENGLDIVQSCGR